MYWGGGFWGPWAVGVGTAVLFGEIVDEEDGEKEQSYQVAPDSPGAKVLSAYALTQVPCGNEGLVVIHGPNNSVVCANPNSTIAAGQYVLDQANLTLSSKV